MRWNDRVYGEVAIADPDILAADRVGPTFQRLEGVRQAGPSAIAFPFKNVTRFEHSLGVYLLLGRLGADRREQVAGLLHDISHTAFSHAVDFVVTSEEQDHHESLKPVLLDRPDVAAAVARLGFSPRDFYDDSVYPLLERPLPWLCADRLDYFLRDGLACGVVTPATVAPDPRPPDRRRRRRSPSTDLAVAREAAALLRRDEPRLVGQPDRGVHLQRIRRRPPRRLPARGHRRSSTCSPRTPASWPSSTPPAAR